jgi:hypothetical protein
MKNIERASRFYDQAKRIAENPDEASDRAFIARVLAQVTLPHSKTEANEFERTNGAVKIRMVADPQVGLPFGTYPRLLLTWVTTEAVRTRSPVLELGDSLSQFMGELGVVPTGGRWGSVTRLREQMSRLITTNISWEVKEANGRHRYNVPPIYASHLFWDPTRPHQTDLWQSTIELNHHFFEAIVERPVPVNMQALKLLAHGARSPMALDIYTWLTYRLSYLREPTTIPWSSLEAQFGGSFERTRDFKTGFLKQLKVVLEVWPHGSTPKLYESKELRKKGLVVEPGSTHLKRLPPPKSPA